MTHYVCLKSKDTGPDASNPVYSYCKGTKEQCEAEATKLRQQGYRTEVAPDFGYGQNTSGWGD